MKKPNLILKELNRIAAINGGILSPETVVKEAEKPSSPLHSKFTWDDTKAAHEYRLEEARRLIRVVVNVLPNGSDKEERVFVSLKADRGSNGGYRTLVSVLSNTELREQLLEQAMDDMEYFAEKYATLRELADVFSSIRKVKARLLNKPSKRELLKAA